MQKTILLFVISFLILSCGENSKKEESTNISEKETSMDSVLSKIGRTNYAVIWKWTTTDIQLVKDNSETMSKELFRLWEDDVVENTYYDAESEIDKLEYFPNIAFFLKAHDIQSAKSILDELTVVQKGIATYQLNPVGSLWLDRKTDLINKKGVTNSYVTVWTSNKPTQPGSIPDDLLKSQNDKMIALWKEGTVENVYFDIEGTFEKNEKTDFVFFVNTNTRDEADEVCVELPFFKKGLASYKIYPVGVFWMGKFEKK